LLVLRCAIAIDIEDRRGPRQVHVELRSRFNSTEVELRLNRGRMEEIVRTHIPSSTAAEQRGRQKPSAETSLRFPLVCYSRLI
jgi:hypothetical protein